MSNSKEAEALYDQAVDKYAEDDFDGAIALYQKALEVDPGYDDALHGLVMCYQAKGDINKAIELTKDYLKRNPEDILAYTNLSMFYQRQGLIKEAEAAAAEARRLDWKRQLKGEKK